MSAFDKYVLPILPKLIPGEITRVEGTDEEIAKILDKNIGIDLMLNNNEIYYGIASRIQINSRVWNTFTIRCWRDSGNKTELDKLREAIKNDAMRPHFTMQAYVVNDKLQTIAITKTKNIIDFIDKYPELCIKNDSFDGRRYAKFIAVKWGDMQKKGYEVRGINNTKEEQTNESTNL
jgi:hypothetical protein